MNRKTILGHGVGTVFALKNRSGWHVPIRLLDTRVWRCETYGVPSRHRYVATDTARTDAYNGRGYPALRILAPGSLSDARITELTTLLGTLNLAMDQIINPDGTFNRDHLPADIGFDLVTSRELTSTWAEYETEQQAERAKYEAWAETDRARRAEQDAARKERQERHAAAMNTAREHGRTLGAAMARMGIEGGGIYPRSDNPGPVVRVEINLAALTELVNRAMWATTHAEYVPDTGCTLRRNTATEES